MAGFKVESARIDDGRELRSNEATATMAISQLSAIKASLLALRAKVNAGVGAGTHTAADVAEVDATLASLVAQIQALLS